MKLFPATHTDSLTAATNCYYNLCNSYHRQE